MHHGDLVGELGEEDRLFHRGVATADHRDVAAAEEEAVTGGACRHAGADQFDLALDAEHQGASASGDDDRPGAVLVVFHPHAERARREVDACGLLGEVLGAEPGRLGAEHRHEVGTEDAVDEAGVVLDLRREHQLAAGLVAR